MTPGSAQWTMSFEISPIVFCNGIAAGLPGGVMPIISITESDNFAGGIASSGGPLNVADYFAHFVPLPGSTLGDNQIGNYPFANQAVAGNAIIRQPRVISALMICPARDGYADAQARMMALIAAFDQHDALGGTYTYVTPKYPYLNLVHLRTVDVSTSQTKQAQNSYQIDFYQPLLTLEAAQAAQSSLMSKLSSGAPIQGQPSYSGAAASVGQPSSLAGASIPAGAGSAGTSTAPLPTPPIPPLGGQTMTT
jgi:hypothetical protein